MNAQTTHTTNDTVDPQFLGPEAGQQAGVGSHDICELEPNGSEMHRYFSVARGALISIRSNGVTLCRQVDDDWKVLSRKKAECSLAQWVANKKALLASLRISAIVDARFSLIVDGETASSKPRRGALRVSS